jgi:hypothetical protein
VCRSGRRGLFSQPLSLETRAAESTDPAKKKLWPGKFDIIINMINIIICILNIIIIIVIKSINIKNRRKLKK